MGWNDNPVTKSIWITLCQNPKLAGHAVCGPTSSSAKKNLELLQGELGELEQQLYYLEYVPEFSDYAHKIEELRGKISTIKDGISKTLNYASTYEDGKALLYAIRRIRGMDPATDPIGTAKAYGAAMKSLGNLIEKLPPPANAVGTLIAEMGRIFHQVVANMQPEVHHSQRERNPVMNEDLQKYWD